MPASREAIFPEVWADFYFETDIHAAIRDGDMLRVTELFLAEALIEMGRVAIRSKEAE